jgi:hypothetical protein
MADRFDSAWLKLERASKHIDDLATELDAFWATEPYEIELTESRESKSAAYRIARMQALPESLALITGDAAHNIRSALDHFACAAVPRPDRATTFPVWRAETGRTPTADQWRKKVVRVLDGASPGLITALLSLEVWETGRDSFLWAVHELDRLDKHRLLISIATVNTRIGFHGESYQLTTVKKFGGFALDQPLLLERTEWVPLTPGTMLLDLRDGLDLDARHVTFDVDVALAEPELLKGQPVVAQLRLLATRAEICLRELAALA